MKRGVLSVFLAAALALIVGLTPTAAFAASIFDIDGSELTFVFDPGDNMTALLSGLDAALATEGFSTGPTTPTDAFTKVNASGPLDESAWAIISVILGTHVDKTSGVVAEVNITTTSPIPPALGGAGGIPTGNFPAGSFGTWDAAWASLANQTKSVSDRGSIKLTVTLAGVENDTNTNDLAALFVSEGVKTEKLNLTGGAALAIPQDFDIGGVHADGDSTIDLSKVTDTGFLKGKLSAEDGTTNIMPDGMSGQAIFDACADLYGGKDKIPGGLKVTNASGTFSMTFSELESRLASGGGGGGGDGGCDAGFGFAGMFALAALAVLRKKRV
jgi:Synergist-CTERM protein sorting domain-containing protein